jgi:Zn-dependent M28 family amino/carboxypeptidase
VILGLRKGDGVLFSAHFDSVSTAPGATDDGMSVVALLQLVGFLSKNRSRRTAVFNINNGEEDGLHGAQAYVALIYPCPQLS